MVQSAVNGLGTAAVAAVTAAGKVHNIVAAPLDTCGAAMATYCGQNLGAGNIRRIRSGLRSITLVAFVYSALAFLFNMYAGNFVATFFLDASETAILADVHTYLVTVGAAYPLLAVIFIFRNGLQGMGFSRQAMLAGVSELAARAIISFGLVGSMGFRAICFANPLAWVFADAVLLTLYAVAMRRLDRPAPKRSGAPPAPRAVTAYRMRQTAPALRGGRRLSVCRKKRCVPDRYTV